MKPHEKSRCPYKDFPYQQSIMNDNDKRGLTLFLKIFTFQEPNSIFHKHGIVFLFCSLQKIVELSFWSVFFFNVS